MLTLDNISFDLLLMNLARKYGLESPQVMEFVCFFPSATSPMEVQKKYEEIYEKGLTDEE